MQVGSLQETHIFSPNILNTFRAGFSRAAFNLDSSLLAAFPSNLSFVTGGGPGGIVVNGGVTTTGLSGITSAGPNNAAGVWNRRNLFTYTDDLQISKGRHQISAGVWFQRLQDNEDSASRQLGQATFTSLTTFLQGTVSSFQVVPSASELGWRSLFGAWYVEDTIKVRPNLTLRLGLRHEFTTGWNEVVGRAANYITDSNGILVTAPRVGSSAYTENNATKLFSPRIGLAWDVVRQRKDRRPRRIRDLLFVDRRSQLPAEFAAPVQRINYRLPARCFPSPPSFLAQPCRRHAVREFQRPAPPMRRKECRPMRKHRRFRSGTSRWSSNSTPTPHFASPMSDRSVTTDC